MATQRRHSATREPAAHGWASPRRLTLPLAANDNRLPPGLRALRFALLAVLLAACGWLVYAIL